MLDELYGAFFMFFSVALLVPNYCSCYCNPVCEASELFCGL